MSASERAFQPKLHTTASTHKVLTNPDNMVTGVLIVCFSSPGKCVNGVGKGVFGLKPLAGKIFNKKGLYRQAFNHRCIMGSDSTGIVEGTDHKAVVVIPDKIFIPFTAPHKMFNKRMQLWIIRQWIINIHKVQCILIGIVLQVQVRWIKVVILAKEPAGDDSYQYHSV